MALGGGDLLQQALLRIQIVVTGTSSPGMAVSVSAPAAANPPVHRRGPKMGFVMVQGDESSV
jgi:hypothetical protein